MSRVYHVINLLLLRRMSPHGSTQNWGHVSYQKLIPSDMVTEVGDLGLVPMQAGAPT